MISKKLIPKGLFVSISYVPFLLASEWRSNFCSESQNHMLVMHIITHFFPIFLNFQRSEDEEKRMGEEEEGQEARAEGGVEVMRSGR